MSQATIHAFATMPVRHNGRRYQADEPITDAAAAKFLVMHRLARPAPVTTAGGEQAQPLTDEARHQVILDAMLALDTENAELLTANGAPQVSVLDEATGLEITAAERDAIWAEIQAETGGEQG